MKAEGPNPLRLSSHYGSTRRSIDLFVPSSAAPSGMTRSVTVRGDDTMCLVLRERSQDSTCHSPAIKKWSSRQGSLVIGRAPKDRQAEAERLDTPQFRSDKTKVMSSTHAKLVWKEGVPHLSDSHSTNGTFVNGVELVPGVEHKIATNDEITFGREVTSRHSGETGQPLVLIAWVISSVPQYGYKHGMRHGGEEQETWNRGRDDQPPAPAYDSEPPRRKSRGFGLAGIELSSLSGSDDEMQKPGDNDPDFAVSFAVRSAPDALHPSIVNRDENPEEELAVSSSHNEEYLRSVNRLYRITRPDRVTLRTSKVSSAPQSRFTCSTSPRFSHPQVGTLEWITERSKGFSSRFGAKYASSSDDLVVRLAASKGKEREKEDDVISQASQLPSPVPSSSPMLVSDESDDSNDSDDSDDSNDSDHEPGRPTQGGSEELGQQDEAGTGLHSVASTRADTLVLEEEVAVSFIGVSSSAGSVSNDKCELEPVSLAEDLERGGETSNNVGAQEFPASEDTKDGVMEEGGVIKAEEVDRDVKFSTVPILDKQEDEEAEDETFASAGPFLDLAKLPAEPGLFEAELERDGFEEADYAPIRTGFDVPVDYDPDVDTFLREVDQAIGGDPDLDEVDPDDINVDEDYEIAFSDVGEAQEEQEAEPERQEKPTIVEAPQLLYDADRLEPTVTSDTNVDPSSAFQPILPRGRKRSFSEAEKEDEQLDEAEEEPSTPALTFEPGFAQDTATMPKRRRISAHVATFAVGLLTGVVGAIAGLSALGAALDEDLE